MESKDNINILEEKMEEGEKFENIITKNIIPNNDKTIMEDTEA